MQRSVYKHIICDTLSATGGEIIVIDDVLFINGTKICTLRDVRFKGVVYVPAVASETLGKVTFTVASANPANSTVYSLTIVQSNPNAKGAEQNPIVKTYSITTPPTGVLTPTTVDAQLLAAINADASKHFTAVGGATLALTAAAGYPILTGSWTANPDASTVVQTTQGVTLAGSLAEMYALGVTTATQLPPPGVASNTVWATGTAGTLATTFYDLYYFESFENIGESNTARINQGTQICLWIGREASNRSAFEAVLENILAGFLRDGTTTSNHQLEVLNDGSTQ